MNDVGKVDVFKDECEGVVNVSRLMIAYKPKRGYEVFSYEAIKYEVLFDK